MRKEPYTVGSIVHAIKRGSRGLEIVLDGGDRWRFLLMLRHLNDVYQSKNWFRDIWKEDLVETMERPSFWPEQEKLVHILAFTLLDNHFHLLLKEIKDGGITEFMHRLGTSMSKQFNDRYDGKGSIFQGPFRSVTVESDKQLRYLAVYIMVKNTFEMYPDGGLSGALTDFEKAWQWAVEYPYSSLGDYVGTRNSPILDKDILGEVFTTPEQFKDFAKDSMEHYQEKMKTNLKDMILEDH